MLLERVASAAAARYGCSTAAPTSTLVTGPSKGKALVDGQRHRVAPDEGEGRDASPSLQNCNQLCEGWDAVPRKVGTCRARVMAALLDLWHQMLPTGSAASGHGSHWRR